MKNRIILTILTLGVSFGIDAASEKSLKQAVIDRFGVTALNSGADVSASEIVAERTPESESEIVSLIAGYRDVIWDDSRMSLWEDEDREMIERLLPAEKICEVEGFYFRPEGEKKALQLVKMRLLESGKRDVYLNDYLFGLLLGYPQADVEFYYYFYDFTNRVSRFAPSKYAQFSQEERETFEHYKKECWPNSHMSARLEADKHEAEQWLVEHEAYSVEDLHRQIQELRDNGSRVCNFGIKFSISLGK